MSTHGLGSLSHSLSLSEFNLSTPFLTHIMNITPCLILAFCFASLSHCSNVFVYDVAYRDIGEVGCSHACEQKHPQNSFLMGPCLTGCDHVIGVV